MKSFAAPAAAVGAFVNWLIGSTARRLFEIFKRVFRAPLAVAVWLWRSFASAFNGWFAAAQALSLLLTLSVPVVAYILIGYNDQWGSTADIVTAFATGFRRQGRDRLRNEPASGSRPWHLGAGQGHQARRP